MADTETDRLQAACDEWDVAYANLMLERDRLRAENEALKGSWALDANHRDELFVVVQEAAAMLSMTQCPYYVSEGKCDRGCSQEPACQTDQPTEGWVLGALDMLSAALGDDEDDDAPASDEQGQP